RAESAFSFGGPDRCRQNKKAPRQARPCGDRVTRDRERDVAPIFGAAPRPTVVANVHRENRSDPVGGKTAVASSLPTGSCASLPISGRCLQLDQSAPLVHVGEAVLVTRLGKGTGLNNAGLERRPLVFCNDLYLEGVDLVGAGLGAGSEPATYRHTVTLQER